MRKTDATKWLIGAAGAVLVWACAAQAQEDAATTEGGLEEIVVTAQKRGEKLQNVPIAITALTANQLVRANIQSVSDLTLATPSLNFSQTAVFAQPYIRGVGTDSFSPGNEASVATYVDGVYIASMNAGTFALNNIARIEVLKGPQGTLYGRNSTGGLINVITETPDEGLHMRGNISYGNYQRIAGQAYIAGGIASGIAADLAVSVSDQGNGYYRNLGTGHRIVFEDGTYLRSKLVADLSSALRLTLAGDYADFRNTLANARQPAQGTIPAATILPGTYSTTPGLYYNSRDDLGRVKDWGLSATAAVDMGAAKLVSITAYRRTAGDQYLDGDDSSAPLSDTITHQNYRQLTQEVQLLSPDGAPLEWIVGAFYMNADAGWNPIDVYANGVRQSSSRLFSKSVSAAIFGQTSLHIGGGGRLTVGARYSYDKKDYRRSFAPASPVSDSWKRPTWRIAYDQRLNGATLAYASYNRGYKSGVYNTLFGPPVSVKPETVDSLEIGLKNDLADRKLRINIAAFHTRFRDIQVRSQVPGNSAVSLQNAASARIYGADADIYAALGSDFQLQAGLSWIHSRYTSFPRAEIYIPRATGGNQLTIGDASGNPLPRTPEFSGNVGLSFDHRMADESRLFASANLYVTDAIFWAPGARVKTGGYGVLNGT
ncbi:MAG: TonB-dependent receptor [Sphingobium sp.]|jgi:iron complex outermembrane receptor protein|nr:TonB-dependent receptor [Sphingobium sp.]